MTSKEKLYNLLEMHTSLGLNTSSCRNQSKLYSETYDSLMQDLERSETLEIENRRLNIILDDTKSDYLKTLRERENLKQENEKLKNENKDLKHLEIANLKHSIDEKNEIISDLKLENETYIKESTKVIEQYKQLQEENEKLKKAVTMLYLVAKLYDIEVYNNLDGKDKNLLNEVLGE